MAPGGVKVVRTDEDGNENGEILTKAELAQHRRFFTMLERKDITLERLEKLIDDQPDLHEIAEGKKASLYIWKLTGALAKWVGIVVGALVAWKAYLASGGVKP